MEIDIRSPEADDDLRKAMGAALTVFAEEDRDDDFERHSKMLPRDRFLAAYADGRPVGTTASFSFRLTVPGGELDAGGVTWVAVLPSHRRRGVLTRLMRHQLDDLRERGEPLAILWASEAAIYGRFGYGIAAPDFSLNADRARFAFRDDPGPIGAARIVEGEEARELCARVHERVRREVPGFLVRTDAWWENYRLADPEHWRHGSSPKYTAVIEVDDEPVAYAIYRIKMDWEDGFSKSYVRILEVVASSTVATREIWRYLFGIDLITRVRGPHDPGSPLYLMVQDPRSLQLRAFEGLWLRFVDLGAALAGRAYAADDSVVLEVRDEFCPWNAGRWRVGAEVERTDAAAELELDCADLASAYLGGFDFHQLAAAERVRELKSGAVDRASALFHVSRRPYCPDDF
ncbi:MAG TPA: GNAT family N-acetyltransferase [Gaiellaceae bacterium]